jgi:hypothetical protein
MRAHEFIAEGKRANARPEFERAHPGLVMPGGQGDIYWGRYYDFYRVASLAGMDPDSINNVPDVNFFGNIPLFSAYTEYDRKKLRAILKKLGMKPQDGVTNGSAEIDAVNTESPVRSFKGYPR